MHVYKNLKKKKEAISLYVLTPKIRLNEKKKAIRRDFENVK